MAETVKLRGHPIIKEHHLIHGNFSGQSAAFMDAYHVWRRMGIAMLAVILFYGAQISLFFVAGQDRWNTLWMLCSIGLTAAALLLLAAFQLRRCGGLRALIGHDVKRALKIYIPVILVIYLVCTGMDWGLGFGREDFMVKFFEGLSDAQKILCVLMLVVFPPISEELLFRHFLMRLFPLDRREWQWIAVLFTSALFMFVHLQYEHWPTLLLIGSLGLAMAIARIQTGGILVPVIMHGCAEVIGLSADWVMGQVI